MDSVRETWAVEKEMAEQMFESEISSDLIFFNVQMFESDISSDLSFF